MKVEVLDPLWVIEDTNFEEDLTSLISAVEKSGSIHHLIKYVPFDDEDAYGIIQSVQNRLGRDCRPIVFYGSLQCAARLKRLANFVPGVWCDLKSLECTNYYSYLGKYLLNDDYVMFPYGELKRKKYDLFRQFDSQKLFIRPSSGFKTFNGQLIDYNEYDKTINNINAFNTIEQSSIVIASSAKTIYEEWRLVIVDKCVVAACKYKKEGLVDIKNGCPMDVWSLGEKIAETYSPELAYTMDICRGKDGISLIELNSFSCSGLYAANKEAVVRAINKAALKEYGEIYA